MIDFDSQTLINLCEELDDNNDKVSALKEQIKVVNADTKERITEFAKSNELEEKAVKEAYKYYKSVKTNGESSEDLYTLMAKIDLAFQDDQDENAEDTQ